MGGREKNQRQPGVSRSDLIDPVGIENLKPSQSPSCSLLSDRSLVSLELKLGNTLVLGLTIDNTLGNRPLSTSAPDSDSVDDISLDKRQRRCYYPSKIAC